MNKMTEEYFRLNYVQRDELYLSIPEEPTLKEIFGPFRDPRSVLACRIMKATLGGASHVEDFGKYGIPEVDLQRSYVP
jgi:hypothetical protein